jgi:hypothetical protein
LKTYTLPELYVLDASDEVTDCALVLHRVLQVLPELVTENDLVDGS